MSTRMKFILLGILILAGVSSVLFSTKPEQAKVNNGQVVSVAKLALPKPMPNTVSTLTPKSSEASPYLNIVKEFHQTKNMRSFIGSAIKKPELGGISLAIAAMYQCEDWIKWPKSIPYDSKMDTHIYAKRLEALRLSAQVCGDLQPEDVDDAARTKLRDMAEIQGDIRYAVGGDLRRAIDAKNPAVIRKQVENWLKIKDPYFIDVLAQEVMLSQSGEAKVYWFAGEKISGEAKTDMRKAISLVGCAFGESCDQNDRRLAGACVESSICYSSYFDLIKHHTYKNNPEGYARVMRYYERLVDAIQREDIDAFIKPN